MGASQTKFENYNDYLQKNYPKYYKNHTQVLGKLIDQTKKSCKKVDTNYTMDKLVPNWLDYQSQETISCIVSKSLKELKKSSDGLKIGNTELQKLFTPIKKLSSGMYGMAMSTGYKGSKPFAVMKVSLGNVDDYKANFILHEIIIGLILNNIRKYTPCFTYCYGGFYCAPPLDVKNVWDANKNDYERQIIDIFLEPLDEIAVEELPSDQLYDIFDEQDTWNEWFKDEIKDFIVVDIPDIDTLINNYSKYQQHLLRFIKDENLNKEVSIKFNEIKDNLDKNLIYELRKKERNKNPELDASKLCSNKDRDEITSICLFEMVNNSTDLVEFLKKASKDEMIQVLIMVYCSLYIAYKKYNFIHNDLNPRNILVSRIRLELIELKIDDNRTIKMYSFYVPKIIDYGLSVAIYDGIKIGTLQGLGYHQSLHENISDKTFLFDIFDSMKKTNDYMRGAFNVTLPEEITAETENLEEFINRLVRLSKNYYASG